MSSLQLRRRLPATDRLPRRWRYDHGSSQRFLCRTGHSHRLCQYAQSTIGIAGVQFQLDGANLGSQVGGAGPWLQHLSRNTTKRRRTLPTR